MIVVCRCSNCKDNKSNNEMKKTWNLSDGEVKKEREETQKMAILTGMVKVGI